MMRWLASLTLLAAVLAGCIGADESLVQRDEELVIELLAGPSLWNDPQNAPHADYGWPTLANPPEGELPRWWNPINGTPLPETISGLKHVAASPSDVQSGAGIAMFGSLVFVPGFGSNSYLVDVSEPMEPKLLSTVEAESSHRGVAFIAYPDGRLVVAVATSPGFDVYDVTDPENPELLTQVKPEQTGHKLGVVPGTPIVYNAASLGGSMSGLGGEGNLGPLASRGTEIYDLSDPENPEFVQMFENGYSCHHIFFWNDPEAGKHRAICAGAEHTQIWDTADPLYPEVIVSVPVHHGIAGVPATAVIPVLWSHYAILSNDGNTLIVGDETFTAQASCGAGLDSPLGHLSAPLGAVWFYDISDETNPVLQGWFNPGHELPELYDLCTAHHGRLLPTPDRDLLAMGFYGAGVVLIDFTDPTFPTLVDQFNEATNTWEVWYNDGYIFTGDLSRGMDVFKLE